MPTRATSACCSERPLLLENLIDPQDDGRVRSYGSLVAELIELRGARCGQARSPPGPPSTPAAAGFRTAGFQPFSLPRCCQHRGRFKSSRVEGSRGEGVASSRISSSHAIGRGWDCGGRLATRPDHQGGWGSSRSWFCGLARPLVLGGADAKALAVLIVPEGGFSARAYLVAEMSDSSLLGLRGTVGGMSF